MAVRTTVFCALLLAAMAAPAAAQVTLDPSGPAVKTDRANPSGDQLQPQGRTGPINTQTTGAPPDSPQGETPPGMQAAPQGSARTIHTDEGGVSDGTPKE